MSQRARKTTTQEIENRFADLPLDQQSRLLETLEVIHRFSARQDKREARKKSYGPVSIADVSNPATNAALTEQPSLTGLPDEDHK